MKGYEVIWEGRDKNIAEEIAKQKEEEGFECVVKEIVRSRKTMYSEGIKSKQVEDLIATPNVNLGYRVYLKEKNS